MVDTVSKERRSEIMAKIRSKNTALEFAVRSILHRTGYRYSLARHDLPGKPDIVLPRFRAVVFAHGCFWHRHRCKLAYMPEDTNNPDPDFWPKKFEQNRNRDRVVARELQKVSWKRIVVWECDVKSRPDKVQRMLVKSLDGRTSRLKRHPLPPAKDLWRQAKQKASESRNRNTRKPDK